MASDRFKTVYEDETDQHGYSAYKMRKARKKQDFARPTRIVQHKATSLSVDQLHDKQREMTENLVDLVAQMRRCVDDIWARARANTKLRQSLKELARITR